MLILHAGGSTYGIGSPPDGPFQPELDSTSPDGVPVDATPLAGGESVLLAARSLLLLRTP